MLGGNVRLRNDFGQLGCDCFSRILFSKSILISRFPSSQAGTKLRSSTPPVPLRFEMQTPKGWFGGNRVALATILYIQYESFHSDSDSLQGQH